MTEGPAARKGCSPLVWAVAMLSFLGLSLVAISAFKMIQSGPSAMMGDRPINATASGGDDTRSEVEDAFARATDYAILFNTPKSLDYDESTVIRAVVVAGDEYAARREFQGLAGPVSEARRALAMEVTARLEGPGESVVIEPTGEQRETIIRGQNAGFEWRVRPIRTDPFVLTLTLTNVVTVDGRDYVSKRPALRKRFVVNATAWQRTALFFGSLTWLQIAIALIAAAVAGATYIYRVRKGEPPWKSG